MVSSIFLYSYPTIRIVCFVSLIDFPNVLWVRMLSFITRFLQSVSSASVRVFEKSNLWLCSRICSTSFESDDSDFIFALCSFIRVSFIRLRGGSRKLVRGWRFVEGLVITIKKRFSKRIQGARTPLFSYLPRKNWKKDLRGGGGRRIAYRWIRHWFD